MTNMQRWEDAYGRVETLMTKTDREVGPVLRDLMTALTDSALFIAQSDELFREAERAVELGLEAQNVRPLRDRANQLNVLAIDALDRRIPSAVEAFRVDFDALPVYNLEAPLRTFEETVRERLLELDLRGDQTRAVAAGVRRAMDAGRSKGAPGLCELVLENTRELSNLRHRRTEHNDPVAVGLSIGFAALAGLIFAVCTANNGGTPCTDGVAIGFAVLLFGLAVAMMITQFIAIGGTFFA